MRLRRLPAAVTAVARAAAVLGDGAPLPAVAALAEAARGGAPPTALAALARAEIVRDEQPLAFVHPLVREAVYRRPAGRRAGAAARARGRRAARRRRQRRAGRARTCCCAPPRGDQAPSRVLRAAARTAAARGASDSAVTYLRRALDEPPAGHAARDGRCSSSGLRRGAARRRRPAPAPARGATRCTTTRRPRARSRSRSPAPQVFAGAARSRDRVRPRGGRRRRCPPALADHAQALLALERVGGYMHGLRPGDWRTAPAPGAVRRRPRRADAGRHPRLRDDCSTAPTATGAVALARFALDGDRLWPVDDGLLWVVAAVVRMVADDDIGDFWSGRRAEAHRRGSLFAALSTNVWQGFWHWRRGGCTRRWPASRAALDQDRMWGGPGSASRSRAASRSAATSTGATWPRPGRPADAALAAPRSGEGARLLPPGHRAAAGRGGPAPARRSAALDRRRRR